MPVPIVDARLPIRGGLLFLIDTVNGELFRNGAYAFALFPVNEEMAGKCVYIPGR
jgi:hypothetical protein